MRKYKVEAHTDFGWKVMSIKGKRLRNLKYIESLKYLHEAKKLTKQLFDDSYESFPSAYRITKDLEVEKQLEFFLIYE